MAKEKVERNLAIFNDYIVLAKSRSIVARKYKISETRVTQITDKEFHNREKEAKRKSRRAVR
jgi:hypothetical protein